MRGAKLRTTLWIRPFVFFVLSCNYSEKMCYVRYFQWRSSKASSGSGVLNRYNRELSATQQHDKKSYIMHTTLAVADNISNTQK